MSSGNLSKKFDSPLIINIKVSRLLGLALLASHLGAAVLILAIPLPIEVQTLLLGALLVSLYPAVMRHALRRGSGAVTGLEIDTDGEYTLRRGEGAWLPCQYIENFLSPWLVIVRLRPEGRRWPVSVVLARDAVEATAFRELRARLHFQVTPTTF